MQILMYSTTDTYCFFRVSFCLLTFILYLILFISISSLLSLWLRVLIFTKCTTNNYEICHFFILPVRIIFTIFTCKLACMDSLTITFIIYLSDSMCPINGSGTITVPFTQQQPNLFTHLQVNWQQLKASVCNTAPTVQCAVLFQFLSYALLF